MSSDQKAVISLINRSMALTRELNDTRRAKRALERRLAESEDRVVELESRLAGDAAPPPPLRAA
jgi:hypothetical protein